MSETKKLYRSEKEHIIAGVAGGLSEYFKVDPVVVRVSFVLLTLFHGAGILLYVILALIIPKAKEGSLDLPQVKEAVQNVGEEAKKMAKKVKTEGKNWFADTRIVIGIIAVVIGIVALTSEFLPLRWFNWDLMWKVALLIIGLYLIFKPHK